MRVVIINGMPGVGKTRLAKRLAKDLELPLISKDMFKEFLFDQIGTSGFEDSKFLGKVSVKMLYALLKEYIADERPLVIENAFYAAFARQDIGTIISGQDVEVIEVYCRTDEATRHARFSSRIASGERHPGHSDSTAFLETSPETYAPLELGEVIEFDTTTDDAASYQALLQQLGK